MNITSFIETYEKYYFKEYYKKDDKLGIRGLKVTSEKNEEIIVKKLNKGEHDKNIIAWKFGIFDNDIVVNSKKMNNKYRTFDLTEYIERIDKQRDRLANKLEKIIIDENNMLCCVDDLLEVYNEIKKNVDDTISKKGFGMVYIINSMFFLSKGKIPIYDVNAYRAVKALYLNKIPKSVEVSENPISSDSVGVIFRLMEYMWLINQVFGKDKCTLSVNFSNMENKGYISRGLDRALWVYGQCTKVY